MYCKTLWFVIYGRLRVALESAKPKGRDNGEFEPVEP